MKQELHQLLKRVEQKQLTGSQALSQLGYPTELSGSHAPTSTTPGPALTPSSGAVPPYSTAFRAGEPYLRDHLVLGKQVLLGVTHASLAIQAVLASDHRGPFSLQKLLFSKPLILEPGERADLSLEFEFKGNHQRFESSFRKGGLREVAASGELSAAPPPAPSPLRLEAYLAELENGLDRSRIYIAAPDEAIVHGPALRTVDRLVRSTASVFAEISLPEEMVRASPDYHIHPALLDGAIVAAVAGFSTDERTPFVPFMIKRIHYYGDLGRRCYGLIKEVYVNREIREYDIDLLDSDGQPMLVLKGFCCKRIASRAAFLGDSSDSAAPLVTEPPAATRGPEPSAPTANPLEQEAVEAFLFQQLAPYLSEPNEGPASLRTRNFMDMGIDSNSLVLLIGEIEKKLAVELYPTLFFENANLAELAAYFLDEHRGALAKLLDFEPAPKTPGPVAVEPVATTTERITPHRDGLSPAGPVQENGHEIAIIGMDGYFPKAADPEQFWAALRDGKDLIEPIPAERFDYQAWHHPEPGHPDRLYCKWGSFVKDVTRFDAPFFNITPKEARVMDPQLRLLLEIIYGTALDAGYGGRLAGSRTGVYVGVCFHDFALEMGKLGLAVDPHEGTGNAATMLSNRPSFYFDLHGPSLTVDTACSSSLVALHLACRALRNGDCETAFAAGTNLLFSSHHYRYFCSIGALSGSGRCHSFDGRADGYVPGEGVAALLLKPLARARADGDRIHAVIKGSAINHGGYTPSITAPSARQETQVILEAWRDAAIDPACLGLIEAHGTGTKLGDPIEVNALKAAFKGFTTEEAFCALGSAKAHMGHAEGAAGIVGVIKAVLSIKHKTIPAMPFFEKANPYFTLAKSPLYINDETLPWPDRGGQPRRAGVSSFGFGGAYAHLVLEEFQNPTPQPIPSPQRQVMVFSAKTKDGLWDYVSRLADFLTTPAGADLALEDLACTLQLGREAFKHRLAVVVTDKTELINQLKTPSREGSDVLLLGSADPIEGDLRLILQGRPGKVFLDAVYAQPDLPKLARLWTRGVTVDWTRLHPRRRRPVSLPRYAFSNTRFPLPTWVGPRDSLSGTGTIAPIPKATTLPDAFFYKPIWRPNAELSSTPLQFQNRAAAPLLLVCSTAASSLADRLLEALKARDHRLYDGGARGGDCLKLNDVPALTDRLDALEPGVEIWLLVGAAGAEETESTLSNLHALFRILAHRQPLNPLKLVTIGAPEREPIGEPAGNAATAFSRAFANEIPGLRLACLDLSNELENQPEEMVQILCNLPVSPNPLQMIHRRGQLFHRDLEPVGTEPPSTSVLREQGVYLILGGAGGVGSLTSEYLAQNYRAGLVLVGRRPADHKIAAQLSRIEALGGRALYLSADICDGDQLKRAFEAAESLGTLRGVIHAAASLSDGALAKLSDQSLTAGLAAKLRGSMNLATELARRSDSDLDFLLFYSSAQAFAAEPGQSTYVAACAFQDAYALQLDRQLPFAVKTINWGYWGRLGLAAHQDYEQRFAARGILPISAAEGMAALERILSRPEAQWLAVKSRQSLVSLSEAGPSGNEQKVTDGKVAENTRLFLRREIAEMTGLKVSQITAESAWSEIGIDSILSMKLVSSIEQHLGVRMYPNELQEYDNLIKLSTFIDEEAKRVSSKSVIISENNNLTPKIDHDVVEKIFPAKAACGGSSPKPMVFMLSTPRAGSTLMRVMLMGHSGLYAPPELHLLSFRSMAQRATYLKENQREFLKEGLVKTVANLEGLTPRAALERVAAMEREDWPIAKVYNHLNTLCGDRILIDKSPTYAMSAETLAAAEQLNPKPFYIFLVRHPLAVMESFVRNRFDHLFGVEGEPFTAAESIWFQMNTHLREFQGDLPPERRFSLRYEDLVTDPRSIMGRLSDRLGIPFEQQLLEPYEGERLTDGLHHDSLAVGDPNFKQQNKIETSLAEVWRERLDEPPVLKSSTWRLAAELGYLEEDQPLSIPQAGFLRAYGHDPVFHMLQRIPFVPVKPFDLNHFNRVLNGAIRQHGVFGQSFIRQGAGKTWRIRPREPVLLKASLHQWRSLDAQERADRRRRLERGLQARIQPERAPLLACDLIQLNEREFLMVFAMHHLVGDGITMARLAERILRDYKAGTQPDLEAPRDMRYTQFARRTHALLNEKRDEYTAFWRDRLDQVPPLRCPADSETPGPDAGFQTEKTFSTEIELAESGLTAAHLHDSLVLALYQEIGAWTEIQQVTLIHRLHRRGFGTQNDYADTAGWFAGDVPMVLNTALPLGDQLDALHAFLHQMPAGGLSYEHLANQGLLPPCNTRSNLRFNFQPGGLSLPGADPDRPLEIELFRSPQHRRPFLLDLIVRTGRGKMVIIIRYSPEFHHRQRMESLARDWLRRCGLIHAQIGRRHLEDATI